ncbi:MAG: Cytochrome c oxidase assembly protein CtaG/Cox11, partial [Gammaproteobacteria bacterium]|nr:Cytochrome c oxidase assembly protein CtaG/Cox11 [Gammaproteobacteria bacterium]
MNPGTSRTAGKLAILAIAMFGFGYALVPLYNVFCDITGLNGKTGTIAQEEASKLVTD